MRLPALFVLVFGLLFGCVSKKKYTEAQNFHLQAQSILRDSLLTTKNFADSLGHALIFAQGGNELLLEAHEDLQARLDRKSVV